MAAHATAWGTPAVTAPTVPTDLIDPTASKARWRAAIIDLDGTLCDTLGDFAVALNLTLAELGLPAIDSAFISRTVGKGSEHLLRRTLAQVGGDAGLYEAAWQAYQTHYAAINGQHATVYDGALEGVQRLRALGWPLACVTNKPTAFAKTLLQRTGLLAHFDHVFGGDAFARKKPDPLPLLEACRALGTLPAQTLVVGDSRNDAEAAGAAGCDVVLVTYGYNHGEPILDVPAFAHVDRIDAIAL